jgi:hypothetical protein
MPSLAADLVVLDTLGKLRAHGRGLSRHCRAAARMWRGRAGKN